MKTRRFRFGVIVALATVSLTPALPLAAQPQRTPEEIRKNAEEHRIRMEKFAKDFEHNSKVAFGQFLYPGSEAGMFSLSGDLEEGRINTNGNDSFDFKLSLRTDDDIEKIYNYYIKVVASLYPGEEPHNFQRTSWTSMDGINSTDRYRTVDGSIFVSVQAPDVRRGATRNSFSVIFQKGRQTFIISVRNVTPEEFWIPAFSQPTKVAHKTHIDLLLLTPPKPQNVVAARPGE